MSWLNFLAGSSNNIGADGASTIAVALKALMALQSLDVRLQWIRMWFRRNALWLKGLPWNQGGWENDEGLLDLQWEMASSLLDSLDLSDAVTQRLLCSSIDVVMKGASWSPNSQDVKWQKIRLSD
jgi:hypothetical protein